MKQEALKKYSRKLLEGVVLPLIDSGQKEYAHEGRDAFDNFERIARELNMNRKKVLWVFAMKHRDGIAAFLQGHEQQREDVSGRIEDLISYLLLLHAMIWEERNN
jgi:hypothetical protein